jgi:hypothetical protein
MHIQTCRESSRSILSGIMPVCTQQEPPTPTLPTTRCARGGRERATVRAASSYYSAAIRNAPVGLLDARISSE